MKKYSAIVLSALLLCSCVDNNSEDTETAAYSADTSVLSETSTETETETELQPSETVPEKNTEINADMDCDGIAERLVLHPDAENDNSIIYCYGSDGKLLGKLGSRDYFDQLTELRLKWFDDGNSVYPALMSKCETDFFYAEYAVEIYLEDGKPCARRIWQKGGLRENYGPIAETEFYSDISDSWISEDKYNEYFGRLYDNIEEAPSYQTGIMLTEALEALEEQGITAKRSDAVAADIDDDGSDEALIYADKKLYLVKNGSHIAGSADFPHSGFALEWYNDRENIFPAARVKTENDDCIYKLDYNGSAFECTLFARCRQLSEGTEYTKHNGEPITEREYLTACFYTWENKQNRLEYAVSAASKSLEDGTLCDADCDGIPELMTVYGNYTYMDLEIGISCLDTPVPEFLGGMIADEDSEIRKYYDKNTGEYFYISEYKQYGMTGQYSFSADKTFFYKSGIYKENIAGENYCYDGFSMSDSSRLMLASSSFMGEKLDEYRYVNGDEKLYKDRLESYLSDFELTERISLESLLRETAGYGYDEKYEKYFEQALDIEKRYLADPSAAQPKQRTVCFNGENIDVRTKHIEFDPYKIPADELEKLGEFTDLKSLYLYHFGDGEETEFDLDLLSCNYDRITNISFYSICADFSKLEKFTNLSGLSIQECGVEIPEEISGLTGLKRLSIDVGYDETADMSPLSSLTGLEYVGVSGHINNLDFTRNMTGLKEIYFAAYSNEDNCFSAVSELPDLKMLAMSGMLYPLPSEKQLEYIRKLSDDVLVPEFK